MHTRRGGLRTAAASFFWTAVAVALLFRLFGRWLARYEVQGSSMVPALERGDWLLVREGSPDDLRCRSGQLILARDPREPSRVLLKRVADVRNGGLWLLGDNPPASTDSRTFGWVASSAAIGRPWFRYWPLRRARLL